MSVEDKPFVHEVFAVCEDERDGRQPKLFDQPFQLYASCKPSSSVFFRLRVSLINGASRKIMVYLQITPDRISSLRYTTCNANDLGSPSPPCLELVRQKLGGRRSVARLQFQLHSTHAQLVVPIGFALDEPPDSPARSALGSANSLAAASLFSLYLPHNVLSMVKFQSFARALDQFPTLSAEQHQLYTRMVDLRGLYNGTGGMEMTLEDQDASPLPDKDHDRSTTPPTTASYTTTVAFDTPSRYIDSPPRYEECPGEGWQPKARSDPTAISADSLDVRSALPEYIENDRQDKMSNAPERVLHYGGKSIDSRKTCKRRHSFAAGSPTFSSIANVQRPEKMLRSQIAESDRCQSRLELLLEHQRKQIEQLQKDMRELRRRNTELEGRYGEVEETCCDLESRQLETKETIESILTHTGELDDECEKLGKQMPDIYEEVQDTVKDLVGEWVQENMTEIIKGHIDQQVAAQIALVKTKMCRALQD
ncbi:hypothetical protein CGRA01v4_13196 [Colletotrichum graminicola]|uniref:Uncharacterized protein n=1 Tax=Colletotrichum graminicola (strain M1.001 / M2 / FGSC 10212) TaxID=645133 RepID=E3R076_COLGM|nr:uncharacterized protein GLRG_11660 [Colletotrichum graminicola M1.001]EFQ36514.1 hypothetical protein GLRG_11660 [Colletotrichum graminicola M1.001]WDK21906.1 hypothetical protein CGRA01v4_13196 [Colletotrichum graminicola]